MSPARTLARALLLAALPALLIACSGDKDAPTPSPDSLTPGPTTASEMRAASIRPLSEVAVTIEPYDVAAAPPTPSSAELDPQPETLVYDRQNGGLLVAGGGTDYAWLPDDTLAVHREGRLSLYDAATFQWRDTNVDLGVVADLAPSPDGKRIAIRETDQKLRVLDLANARLLTLPIDRARSAVWSPDSSKLLLTFIPPRQPEDGPAQEHGEVLFFGNGLQHVSLAGAVEPGTHWHWLDGVRLIAWERARLHTYEFNSTRVRLLDDKVLLGPYGGVAYSPDGKLVAVQTGADLTIYEVPSFQFLAGIPRASIGGGGTQHWSPDGRRLAYVADPCGRLEFVSVYDLDRNRSSSAADGGAYQAGFVPDGQRVYYTNRHTLYFAELGPRATRLPGAGQVIHDDVNDVAPVRWSPTGRYVAFSRFYGGYDRCL